VTGYLAIWGDPSRTDAYGTYFDRNHPPDLGILRDQSGNLTPIRLMYEHGRDEVVGLDIIGQIEDVWQDSAGIAFRGTLDKSSPHYAQIAAQLKDGDLFVSSASAEHLAVFDEDGRFRTWLLSEVSLVRNPAEERMPSATIRSAPDRLVQRSRGMLTLQELGLGVDATLDEIMKALVAKVGQAAATAMIAELTGGTKPAANEAVDEMTMGTEERSAPQRSQQPDLAAAIRALQGTVSDIQQRMMSAPAPQPAPAAPAPQSAQRVEVGDDLRYAHMGWSDMAIVHLALRAANKPVSESFRRTLGGRMADAAGRDEPIFSVPMVRAALRGQPVTRANEIMTSTASGAGDEWVSLAYSSVLWDKARASRIYQMLQSKGMRIEEIPQGSESITIMGDGSDPTVYTISQQTDVDAVSRPTVAVKPTRPGTLQRVLSPGTMGASVLYSYALEEDSMIATASQLNANMQETMLDHIEKLMLNGDTATGASTNINLIDGTPGTGTSTPYYIASDGFLKYPLVTATSYARDGGALDSEDYRLTLKLVPYALRSKKQNLAFVVDSDTEVATLGLFDLKTRDVNSQATIEAGELQRIWGIDVLISGHMALANTAGKISATPGNNVKGRILLVYAPYWAFAFKRQIMLETARDIQAQTNVIVASVRLGMTYRSTDGAAAASYNLTV